MLICLILSFAAAFAVDPTKIQQIIYDTQQYLWEQQANSSYWLFPAYLGTNFISEYYLMSNWLGINSTSLNAMQLETMLMNSQLPDGSWKQVEEANKDYGEIDTTIFNYMFLKKIGKPLNSKEMAKAREFILNNGGLEHSSAMTKYKLASLNCFPYSKVSYIPTFIFDDDSIFYAKNLVSQWVYPHLLAMAYFKAFKVTKSINVTLSELFTTKFPLDSNDDSIKLSTVPTKSMSNIIKRIVEIQQLNGSFGGYTVSSLMCSMVLQHFNSLYPNYVANVSEKILRSFSFVDNLYFHTGSSSYKGVLDDGRFWDTALVSWALLESKDTSANLLKVRDYLLANQVAAGGIPYGLDFQYAPDTDDTAISALFMCKYNKFSTTQIAKAIDWLFSMQNNDGGYSAFDKNRGGNWILRLATSTFTDSAEAFDPSSPDVTAHIIEALGACGYPQHNSYIRKMIAYLKKTQMANGGWEGRWGINYIYAIGAIIPAAARVGINVSSENWTAKALDWLVTKQNSDGGWGESSLSYINIAWIGKGISTVSQTSWALMGLLEAKHVTIYSQAIEKGIAFLVNYYDEKGYWEDASCVGTGHRGILYMQYPVYSKVFPLIALSRYLYS